MVEYLIAQGCDATAHDSLNQTPLFYASRDGKLSLVDQFVKMGCHPNDLDSNG
jgi:ankyrin repeat protein